jgi:cobalt-zinc-cadmium efflux system outer membrane protein
MIIFIIYSLLGLSLASESKHTHKEISEHIHGLHRECPLPKNTRDIIDCSLSFHPTLQKEKLEVKSIEALGKKAGQIPNPILISRFVQGEQGDVETSELEANFRFQVELGGKRGARVKYAKALLTKSRFGLEEKKERIKFQTIYSLYRLKQVINEANLIQETITAYRSVIKKLKSIPRISAEQQASLTLFEIGLQESQIHESELYEEERSLEHFFHVATGNSLPEIEKYLPEAPSKWPKVRAQRHSDKSARIKKMDALTEVAINNLRIEEANSWPTLDIGPSLAIEKNGPNQNKMIGVSVRVPIPFFQANGGAKAFAKSKQVKSKKARELAHAFESHERFEQLKVYTSSVRLLEKSPPLTEVFRKYRKLESLHKRGVVSNQSYLDSLKQKVSYVQKKNQRIMTAIKSLWKIYRFDGEVLKKELL